MYSDYRRNSDERLRRLERSNDLQKRVSLIANRVRAGKIYPLEVRVAAYLGDSAALIYMDGDASLGDRHTSREQLSQTYSTFVATPVTEALQYLYQNWLHNQHDIVRFLLWNAVALDFAERVVPLCDDIWFVTNALPLLDNQPSEAIAAARNVVVLWKKFVRCAGMRHTLRPANFSELSREERREIRRIRRQQKQQLRAQEESAQAAYQTAVAQLDPLVVYLNESLDELSEVTAVGEPQRSTLHAICIAVGAVSNASNSGLHHQVNIDQVARWAANARVDYHAPDDAPERLAEIEWQNQRLCQYLLGDVDF